MSCVWIPLLNALLRAPAVPELGECVCVLEAVQFVAQMLCSFGGIETNHRSSLLDAFYEDVFRPERI